MSDWFDFGTAIMGNTVFYDPNNPCTAYQYVKAGYRELDWIRICRIPLSLSFLRMMVLFLVIIGLKLSMMMKILLINI
jgi:hypothetical protein